MNRKLQPVKGGSLRVQVFDKLRQAIFSGDLPPGSRLYELDLARDLRVSQATVREALTRIEHAGLVVRTANKSTVVTSFSAGEVRERVAIRALLENMAAAEAGKRMAEEHFAELSRRLKAISRAILRKAYFESTEADLDFHRYIWEQSGNRTLFCMLDQLSAPLFAYSGLVRRRMGLEEMQNTVPRHEQIIAALRTRDPQIIEHAIRDHIDAAFGQLLKISLVSPDSVTGSESPAELQVGSHR